MRKLAFFLGLAIAIFVSAQLANATQVIDDALQVNSLRVGQQGAGGVTYFNGTIVNETTNDAGDDNPVAFGDNVRIDGRVYRGATAGAGDAKPFIVNDDMEVVGSLTVGTTNVLSSLSGKMSASTYDVAGNGKVDADKLDSGIAATLIGTGTISNTEYGYLNGVTSAIQTQLNTKGVGDMLKSTYDAAGNGAIDASKLDSGIGATLIGTGTISNTEFGYLNGVTSALQTQLNAKGVGDMLKSTYDVAGNGAIDAGKLDSGINATLIGGGGVSDTIFGYLASLNLDNTSSMQLTALGIDAGALVESTGTDNTFIGYQAGDVTSTGLRNVAIGSGALGGNTTADDNVAIGRNALLLTSTTGNRNTGVGTNALDANVNGVYNTALGYGSLGLTTNTGNIGLGYNAGDNITSGQYNLVIGYDLNVASATSSYQLNIGDVIKGSLDSTAPRVDIDAGIVFVPSADQTRANDSTITIDNGIVRVVGDGGAALLDVNPAIEDGAADGQIVIIQGTSDANTVQIVDAVNTALAAGAAVTLGVGDNIQLMWDSGDSLWYEISRANN